MSELEPHYVYVANEHLIAQMVLIGEDDNDYYLVAWDGDPYDSMVDIENFPKHQVFTTSKEAVEEFKRHIEREKSK